jgi:hypothetical protein
MKILNHQRCTNKAWGHEEKSKGSENFEQKKKNQCNDAQNQMKKTKTKRKSLSPTLGGTIDNFEKTIQMTKGQKNKHK